MAKGYKFIIGFAPTVITANSNYAKYLCASLWFCIHISLKALHYKIQVYKFCVAPENFRNVRDVEERKYSNNKDE